MYIDFLFPENQSSLRYFRQLTCVYRDWEPVCTYKMSYPYSHRMHEYDNGVNRRFSRNWTENLLSHVFRTANWTEEKPPSYLAVRPPNYNWTVRSYTFRPSNWTYLRSYVDRPSNNNWTDHIRSFNWTSLRSFADWQSNYSRTIIQPDQSYSYGNGTRLAYIILFLLIVCSLLILCNRCVSCICDRFRRGPNPNVPSVTDPQPPSTASADVVVHHNGKTLRVNNV